MKVYLYNLGCARNIVDGETMLGQLESAGHTIVDDPEDARAIVVNTCGFIDPAAEESVDTILEAAELKKTAACRRLVVAGCLPQRHGEPMTDLLPEVDVFLGTGAYDRVVAAINGNIDSGTCVLPDPSSIPLHTGNTRRILTKRPVAYVKIMEGCNRHCTYCIIPRLRGTLRSRPQQDIVREIADLSEKGFSEIVIVGQDTTSYGDDLARGSNLADLIALAAETAPESWIRFLYGHPDRIDDRLLETVNTHPNICSYFDVPIQHVSPSVLRRMGRLRRGKGESDVRKLEALFAHIRRSIPEATLRTTAMTGFPGETEEDFEQLFEFVKKIGFDHLGTFVYSDAPDLASHKLSGHVPEDVAGDRMNRLMTLQAEISLEKNENRIGREFTVLVEEDPGDGSVIGRTRFQAPEVDGITLVYAEDAAIGDFIPARITGATEYDLEGVPA